MAQQEEQELEPIFSITDKYVVKGWEKINPKNKLPQVPTDKILTFLAYVFENSKDELQMELDQDTDFKQIVDDYLQQTQQVGKKSYTFEQAVDILNWAVDPGEQQQEQQENGKVQDKKNKQQDVRQKAEQKDEKQGSKQQQYQLQNKQKQNKQTSKLNQHQENKQKNNEIDLKQQNKEQINKQQQKDEQKQMNQYQQKSSRIHEEQNNKIHNQEIKVQKQKQNILNNKNHQNKLSDRNNKVNNIQINNLRKITDENEDQMDWGKVQKPQQKNNIKLYKQINSYTNNSYQVNNKIQSQQLNNNQQNNQNQYPQTNQHQKYSLKQPLSIKRSLAKLNVKSKIKYKQNQQRMPLLKLSPSAPQMKYIKKQKIIIKNKKAKPQYNPQIIGLKELFKFYCALNSQFYSISKHKDPAKGTFDELQSRVTNLYMHNFMLICKDFNIIETKNNLKQNNKNNNSGRINQQQKMNKIQNNNAIQQLPMKRRNSKGSVPQTTIQNKQNNKNKLSNQNKYINQINQQQDIIKNSKSLKIKSNTNNKSDNNTQIWDRDKISNYFKKQADYTLNIKYDKFIIIMKQILKDKLIIQQEQTKNNNDTQLINQNNNHKKTKKSINQDQINQLNQLNQQNIQNQNSQQQINQKQQKSSDISQLQNKKQQINYQANNQRQTKYKANYKIDPIIMALCKFFKLQNQPSYQETFKKLKIQYKILQPQTNIIPQKKVFRQLNGHFQQNIAQQLKSRQLQKQKHRIQIKQKYLNKFTAPQIDSYSSFKAATNQINSLNSLYGSGPKLNQNKSNKLSTISQGTYGSTSGAIDYTGNMTKKNSRDYNVYIGSIIKQARNQISDVNKQNRPSNRLKQHSQTQNLAKSRFNPLNSMQNSQKPILGYKKLHDLRQTKQDEETLSSILLNNSRIMEGNKTNRQQKTKVKSKDISSPLLQRMGCHEDDDLLNKYFDQQKNIQKSQLGVSYAMR